MSIATAVLQFLSPRASKVLSPVCTLSHSASSLTVSTKPHDDDPSDQIPEATHESIYSPRDFYSNQRTRNQFRPRNATKGTTSYQLRQYAEATLGGGSLRKIVKLPEGEDENEWLAVNSTTYQNMLRRVALMRNSGRFLQSHQSSLRIDHRVLLTAIMSRDESDR